jgi:hypothetical protein
MLMKGGEATGTEALLESGEGVEKRLFMVQEGEKKDGIPGVKSRNEIEYE